MKAKWFISTLLVVFTLLGTVQESTPLPNQEIVLKFDDVRIADKQVEITIARLKKSLKTAGVSNITIQEAVNGTLKITYYSAINVDNIRKVLSKKNQLLVANSSQENDEHNNPAKKVLNYNFDVYDLNNDTYTSSSDDNSIIEIKFDSKRRSTTQIYASLECNIVEINKIFKTAYNTQKKQLFFKNNTSYQIPEVRAGPSIYFI